MFVNSTSVVVQLSVGNICSMTLGNEQISHSLSSVSVLHVALMSVVYTHALRPPNEIFNTEMKFSIYIFVNDVDHILST